MLKKLLNRDRSVMPALILLGLMMTTAGLFAGRSTLDFVLAMDARAVSESWTHWLESQLRKPEAGDLGEGLGDAWLNGVKDLVDRANRREIASGRPPDQDQRRIAAAGVTRASDFALLDADRTVLFKSGGLADRDLGAILRRDEFNAAFKAAVATRSPQVMPALEGLPGNDDGASGRLVLVPVAESDRVHRVYIVIASISSRWTSRRRRS